MDHQNAISRVGQALWERRHPQWAERKPDVVQPMLHIDVTGIPRYVADQATIRARDKFRGRQPWITRDSLHLLDQMLQPGDRGLEFGSGGTTGWFAERVAFLDSVEAAPQYYEPLRDDLARRGLTNVDLHLVSFDTLGRLTPEHQAAYVGVNPSIAEGSLDFVFVDGEYRDLCAMRGADLLGPGGVLILDNADAYLPADTRSPWSVDRPATPLWEAFVERTAGWRSIWTTNGVWDTALWIKP